MEFRPLDEFSLCQCCNDAADTFHGAAMKVRMAGGDITAAYKAGDKAQDEFMVQKDKGRNAI